MVNKILSVIVIIAAFLWTFIPNIGPNVSYFVVAVAGTFTSFLAWGILQLIFQIIARLKNKNKNELFK